MINFQNFQGWKVVSKNEIFTGTIRLVTFYKEQCFLNESLRKIRANPKNP